MCVTLTGWDPEMSLTARLLDISVSLWTGQLATVSSVFSCHMRHTDQAAGECEGHFSVSEADVSVDTMPLERSQFVVKRASAVRAEQGSTAQHRATGEAEGNFNTRVKPHSSKHEALFKPSKTCTRVLGNKCEEEIVMNRIFIFKLAVVEFFYLFIYLFIFSFLFFNSLLWNSCQ